MPGIAGQTALGLHVDWRGRLWVAGGANKTIRVYNAKTGALLRTYTFPDARVPQRPRHHPQGRLRDRLDSTSSSLRSSRSASGRLTRHAWGKLPAVDKAKILPLTGDIAYTTGFNANGIVAKSGWLILVQSNTGLLFRVNPRTGATSSIDTHGYSVLNGDGLVLRGRWLYVVRNQNNLVAVLKLGLPPARRRGSSARSPRPASTLPTTATFAVGKLWAVNARFSTAPTPTTPYWITRLRVHP